MSEDKRYWPTATRLARLRAEGIIPRSTAMSACAALTGMILAVVALLDSFEQVLRQWDLMWRAGRVPDEIPATDLTYVLLGPAAAAAVMCLCAAFLLGRFSFGLHHLAPRIDRLLPKPRFSMLGALFGAARTVAAWLTALVACGLLVPLIVREALLLFRAPPDQLTGWLAAAAGSLLPIALFLVISAGFLAAVLARARFNLEHRMTRAELEAEIRESE